MSTPQDLRYTKEHEWCAVTPDGRIRVGITDYAQGALGDIVYVQLPATGESVAAGDTFGEVESTKSVSDLYAPIAGTVVAVNEALDANPELINSAPFGDGWIIELEGDVAALDALLDAAAYQQLVDQG
jgi:glycine cleavage system H protein